MNEERFKTLMLRAKTFQGITDPEYWRGFQRGLRRLYHGENFGTEEEHRVWDGLVKERGELNRRQLGEGYRAGCHAGELRLTTNHSMSSYNLPVFVDAEDNPMDYTDGLKRLRAIMGWSRAELAEKCGVKPRTVDGWEGGKPVSGPALKALAGIVRRVNGENL